MMRLVPLATNYFPLSWTFCVIPFLRGASTPDP
jgi:hypothetical protein